MSPAVETTKLRPNPEVRARWSSVGELPAADLAILGYVAGLLVLWGPHLSQGLVTPRLALMAVALGPGLVVLTGLVRSRDRAALWVSGYLGWAMVATLAGGAPRISMLGGFGIDRGWLVLAGYVATWALGRRLGPGGRPLLPAVVLGGLGLGAVVAVFQAWLEPTGVLALVDGRASGLTESSVYFGLQMGGGLVLAAVCTARAGRRWPLGLGGVTLFALAANLSGSRSAIVVGVAGALLGAARWSCAGRQRLVRVAAVAGAIVVGLAMAGMFGLTGASSARLEGPSAGGGIAPRVTMWQAGVAATGERPLVGWGPGRFRTATSTRTTAAFARAEGPDRLFFDAHNLLIEHLTTTGVVGLVLLVGFGVSVARAARGPLAWFGTAIALGWMLSPLSISTGPLVLLALGAASPVRVVLRSRRGAQAVGVVLAAVGLLAGGSLLIADFAADDAVRTRSVASAQRAVQFFPADATLADLESQAWGFKAAAGGSPTAKREALAAAHRAVHLDPTRPTWWVHLGFTEANQGAGSQVERIAAAERSFRTALRLNPWSASALEGMRAAAIARHDAGAKAHWEQRLCQVVTCAKPR